MRILWASIIEILILLLTILAGVIPLVKEIRGKNKKLNRWGWLFAVALLLFGILNIQQIVANKIESFDKAEKALLNRKTDSISFGKLSNRLSALVHADSSLKAAVQKSGLLYDSVNGKIIAKNVQIVNNGSALQNNAPNYGYQAGRDINLNSEKELPLDVLAADIKYIKSLMKEYDLLSVIFMMTPESNGGKIKAQYIKALTKDGIIVSSGMIYSGQQVEGRSIRIDKGEKAIFIDIGRF